MKIGICQWSLPIDGPHACKLAAQLGIDGIQLDIGGYERGFPLSRKIVQESYLELGDQYGVSFPSIAVNETSNWSMTTPKNSQEHQIIMTAITKAIETAEIMNIPLVMIPSFEASDIKNEFDFQRSIETLQDACDYAKDLGITIATENLLSIDEMFRLFNGVNRSNLKLYFDTQNHYLSKGYDIPEMIEKLGSLFCNEIHVKDGRYGYVSGSLLGEGDSGFFRSMEVLKKIGYSGWINIENYYDQLPLSLENDNPVELIKKDIETLKSTINEVEIKY
ncbi:sugar phosphate isomerase/epimerase family protein [Neobacillus sp. NPDC097160]|uniref:sugar phosphate isomerase/epimerase family protein n=1 Tax=Neobacillus sp. NPDC097160 TaxID=3364298 RepID=UPI0037FF01BF